jgi:proline-specific peptidase
MVTQSVAVSSTETFVAVEDRYRVWAKVLGGGAEVQRPALLVLHGGPGFAHDYLENLSELATSSQKVVFYDQLGCGRSDAPDDPGRWQLPRFVREVDRVRQALDLKEVVILGQSWGGMLAMEYMLTKPSGVAGLVLSNTLASAALWAEELKRLTHELPEPHMSVIKAAESGRDIDPQDYQRAVLAFSSRHLLRMDPLPPMIVEALQSTSQVYEVMWGKSEFSVSGNLKSWDRTQDLGQIDVPVQIISGEFDESTPKQNEVLHQGLKNSKWTLMPGCSHLSNLENPREYLAIVQAFLDRLFVNPSKAT